MNLQRIKAVIQYTRTSYTLQLDDKQQTLIPLSNKREIVDSPQRSSIDGVAFAPSSLFADLLARRFQCPAGFPTSR